MELIEAQGAKKTAILKVVAIGWSIFTTLAVLILGYQTYGESSVKNRLVGREKLDLFMGEVRDNFNQRCDSANEVLRPIWQGRYEVLVELAKIDSELPPYNMPCKKYSVPRSPSGLAMNLSSVRSYPAVRYATLEEFIGSEIKKATLWIDTVPIEVDISSADWSSAEEAVISLKRALEDCVNREYSKVENTYIKIDCMYYIDESNNAMILSIEQK